MEKLKTYITDRTLGEDTNVRIEHDGDAISIFFGADKSAGVIISSNNGQVEMFIYEDDEDTHPQEIPLRVTGGW